MLMVLHYYVSHMDPYSQKMMISVITNLVSTFWLPCTWIGSLVLECQFTQKQPMDESK